MRTRKFAFKINWRVHFRKELNFHKWFYPHLLQHKVSIRFNNSYSTSSANFRFVVKTETTTGFIYSRVPNKTGGNFILFLDFYPLQSYMSLFGTSRFFLSTRLLATTCLLIVYFFVWNLICIWVFVLFKTKKICIE